jgi:hypothetical protein
MRSLILVSVIAATACNGDSPSGSSGAVAIIHVTPSMRSCSDAAVLECGRYGVFRALAPGAVTITARLAELVATKTVTVVQ